MTVRDTYMILVSAFLMLAIALIAGRIGVLVVEAVDTAVGFC